MQRFKGVSGFEEIAGFDESLGPILFSVWSGNEILVVAKYDKHVLIYVEKTEDCTHGRRWVQTQRAGSVTQNSDM